ncbi:hypothetical protein TNCV_2381601 [Trichonephila clavipes]|nr:hypothetical protein TNCV_2381601 [Trichonephila clavipes]
MHLHTMTPPPPCFTVGTKCSFRSAVQGFIQTNLQPYAEDVTIALLREYQSSRTSEAFYMIFCKSFPLKPVGH